MDSTNTLGSAMVEIPGRFGNYCYPGLIDVYFYACPSIIYGFPETTHGAIIDGWLVDDLHLEIRCGNPC